MRQQTPPSNPDQPPIQPAPSTASLSYSMDTDIFPPPPAYQLQRSERIEHSQTAGAGGSFGTTEDSIDHSLCSEMMDDYNSFQGYSYATADNTVAPECKKEIYTTDATETVHKMHKMLLRLLSEPSGFHEALEWEELVMRGVDDPAAYLREGRGAGKLQSTNGIKSFESEFDEDTECPTSPGDGASEQKQSDNDDDSNNKTFKHSANEDFSNVLSRTSTAANKNDNKDTTEQDYTPLAHQIFTSDAEVVLPQALTASQLFGIERVTGIELEAAAGIAGLSHLFLRWLALMPEGDHMNIIDPPGLTVMRIAGGRYRVTGAHRVVWRWMNSFSPASALMKPSTSEPRTDSNAGNDEGESRDTDFDFGDLVTMTIIDVFETDSDGKLLSYCPTFDNRAVHKTQEVTERIRKGASNLMERMDVVKKSPAGKSVNRAAGNFGKMAISVGSLVRTRIEEEIHKHQKSPKRNDGTEDEVVDSNLNNVPAMSTDEPSADNAPASKLPTRRMEV
ncbi:hypothetical protein ACHAXN_011658 [Cyclotella atomus]